MQIFKSFKKLLGKGLFSPVKLLLLVLPIMIFFSSPMKPLAGENRLLSILQNIIYPVQYVFTQVGTAISDRYNGYFKSLEIAAENKVLKEKLVAVQAQLLDYREKKEEIRKLEELLQFSKEYRFKNLSAARVISVSNQFISSGLRVSSGTANGVKPGMPVLAPSGLVGKVLRANFYFSDIQLVSDDNFVLDVFIERTRVSGLLRGGTREKSYLTLEKKVDIRIGDQIISSGMLNIFPRGVPVGEVVNISYDSRKEYQTVEVRPKVRRNSLEKVVILKRLSEDRQVLAAMIKQEAIKAQELSQKNQKNNKQSQKKKNAKKKSQG